jgi:mRNA-degrading endonuclease RelE of RelBE toxin-antitoxin system
LPCLIDDSTSQDFVRQRKALAKDYPKLLTDLATLYEDIRKDYAKVQQAHSIPGYKNTVWKYRCESSDMGRGKSGGFRVTGYFREADNTMYMICVHTKKQFEQPPGKDLMRWLKSLQTTVDNTTPKTRTAGSE